MCSVMVYYSNAYHYPQFLGPLFCDKSEFSKAGWILEYG